jgi:hypothetical protein
MSAVSEISVRPRFKKRCACVSAEVEARVQQRLNAPESPVVGHFVEGYIVLKIPAAQRHDPHEPGMLVTRAHPPEHPHQLCHRHLHHPAHRFLTTQNRRDADDDMQMPCRSPACHICSRAAPAGRNLIDRIERNNRQRHGGTPFRHGASFGQGREFIGQQDFVQHPKALGGTSNVRSVAMTIPVRDHASCTDPEGRFAIHLDCSRAG